MLETEMGDQIDDQICVGLCRSNSPPSCDMLIP